MVVGVGVDWSRDVFQVGMVDIGQQETNIFGRESEVEEEQCDQLYSYLNSWLTTHGYGSCHSWCCR